MAHLNTFPRDVACWLVAAVISVAGGTIAQADPDERGALQDEAVTCGEPMAEVCRKRLRNPASSVSVLSTAAALLARFEHPDDAALLEKTWATIGPQ